MVAKQKTTDEQARDWFNRAGWKLTPQDLRTGLEERKAGLELIVELIDEGGKRRREAEANAKPKPQPKRETREVSPPSPAEGAPQPQDLEAEEYLLGALLLHDKVIDAVRDIADAGDFFRESHALIYRAALELHDEGAPVDPITLTHELEQRGELERVGGRVRMHELAALVPATANAPHYARIVRDMATLRGFVDAGGRIAQLGWDRKGDTDELASLALEIANEATERSVRITVRERLVPGGAFILDGPATVEALWSDGDDGILWAAGEGLMICGPQGVGKTTLMQQLALARCGLLSRTLGFAVAPAERRVLYLAADRPAQARRSLGRMVADHNRDELDQRLVVHPGPPDQMVDEDPRALLRLCEQAGADTLFVDSVKDVCLAPADEVSAAKANLAWQYMVSAGVEVVLGHHQRKGDANNKKPDKLDDVYGNQRLYSGLGSVILLYGEAGDVRVEFKHLKQPSEEVGPWKIHHEHSRGISSVQETPDVLSVLNGNPAGMTADDVARAVLDKAEPTRNEIEKTRQKLNRRSDKGILDKLVGEPPRYRVHIPGVG